MEGSMEGRSKEYFSRRVADEMVQNLRRSEWTTRQKVALTCRMLAREDHASGLAGQITVRGDADGTLITARFGLGFDEVTASNLIVVDDDLIPLDHGPIPNPATRFHLWIYRKRPDVNCIIHTHPPFVSALSMVGEELAVAHMDATPFYEDCGYLKDWPGVPIADYEGEVIAAALDRKRAIILAHHGQLVTGTRVEEAAYLAIFIERAARMQVRARAVGPIQPIRPELGREAHEFMLQGSIVDATFAYLARRVLRDEPECLE
jgi:L-fuculose-phosphate aldolase